MSLKTSYVQKNNMNKNEAILNATNFDELLGIQYGKIGEKKNVMNLKTKPRNKKKWLTVNKSWLVCAFSVNSDSYLMRSCNLQGIHDRWMRHDQRYVQLRAELDPNDARKIIVHTPNIPNRKGIMPPGPYMIFIFSKAGGCSESKTIFIEL